MQGLRHKGEKGTNDSLFLMNGQFPHNILVTYTYIYIYAYDNRWYIYINIYEVRGEHILLTLVAHVRRGLQYCVRY